MTHRRNGRPKKIHHNRLMPSGPDDVELATAVEERFLGLCNDYFRLQGVKMSIPPDLFNDIFRWREMRIRHKQGDFRHTEAELKSVKAVAQWTVNQNCLLKGQPLVSLEWKE